ncbi:molybdenum cofactor guanylyltransferase [Pedobacter zeae]|uniref:Molybdenum cofactor guanylyltransferase n=1 Tax=Pedobacter zeae TaxID=1737356 RepID=A0A7W6P4P4_9SPHI|nr:molybdenum cofactor guanylyltransferase [Pedobacter zeae]MBB4107197.1 molybdopterin-guanine dinucleotide biosynthesis protein A [Pedobacter zeae]GGH06312.1 molybdenum cofactor guanylyltransferase [Pedobacter zeae]
MLGIVLCGGQSLRMGTDKGLLDHQNKIWAQVAAEKLASLNLPVKFSVNPSQQEVYAAYLGKGQLIIDDTLLDVRGPLLGVLSVHLSNPEEDLFLLACDMLLMEIRLMEKLIKLFKPDDNFESYIFSQDSRQEPLCGIYKAKGLKKIVRLLQTNALARHSMKCVLSNLRICETTLESQDYKYFGNFNSKEDIKGTSPDNTPKL